MLAERKSSTPLGNAVAPFSVASAADGALMSARRRMSPPLDRDGRVSWRRFIGVRWRLSAALPDHAVEGREGRELHARIRGPGLLARHGGLGGVQVVRGGLAVVRGEH